jgi:hypothetical protein
MPYWAYLIISAVIGTVLGVIYNALLSKTFSGGKRTVFCVLTYVIFIFSAVSVAVMICAQSYVNSKIGFYSIVVEQYVSEAYSDNEFVRDGIDIKSITDGDLQIDDIISNLKTMIPSPEELNVDKKIYDRLVGYLMNELQNRFNAVGNTVNARAAKGAFFADENGIVTFSSILNLFTGMAVKQVGLITLEIIIVLMIPLAIYIAVTIILAIIKFVSDRRRKEAAAT